MKIKPSARLLAIKKIFHELNLDSGAPLAEVDVQLAWTQTGLRWSDLSTVLRDLIQRGVLEQYTMNNTVYLRLTPLGLNEAIVPHEDLLTRAINWVALRRARHRERVALTQRKLRRRRADSYGYSPHTA